jgi:2Fe-2S ferredoxin
LGGTNPYLKSPEFKLPEQKFRIVFRHEGKETLVEVDPAKIPYGRDGLPGSLLDIALAHGIALDHACGGVCACSTCHVIVREGGGTCSEVTDQENDQLDNAPGLTPKSRLGCQCVPDGTAQLVVEVPGWNRNLVREAPH